MYWYESQPGVSISTGVRIGIGYDTNTWLVVISFVKYPYDLSA